MLKAVLAILLASCLTSHGQEDEVGPYGFRLNDFALLPEYKLVFCSIAKAGSSATTKLLLSISPPPYPQHPFWLQHRPSDYGLNAEDMLRILNDKSWLKAVIYRDPLERFLSAYRSKCEDFDADQTCSLVFHNRKPSFAGAVRQLVLREDFSPDGHFRTQAESCNLNEYLPLYQEQFNLDQGKMYATITRILDKVHVEITTIVNRTLFSNFSPPGVEGIKNNHITHSAEVATLLHYYNHDCFIRLIVSHYQVDYSLFRLPYPAWAVEALERVTLKECVEYIQTAHFD